jgi:hypothetical protein
MTSHSLRSLRTICLVAMLTLSASSPLSAKNHPCSIRFSTTEGSATSTLTDFVENSDGTLSLQAEQEGTLSGFGAFTGMFHYVAHIDPAGETTLLLGCGVFVFDNDDELHLQVTILERGADYPKPFFGFLSITGGTGRFAGARGIIETSGTDGEDFTDPFHLSGVIMTRNFERAKTKNTAAPSAAHEPARR